MKYVGISKLLVGFTLVFNALVQIANNQTWWFIQNVNLIFHEAGHIIFIFFGETLHILGGSFLEILIPVSVVIHFYLNKYYFSAAVTCWWSATAFLSVSIYASDASARILPLITGDVASHDWYNLLLKFNLLTYDDIFGYFFWCCSITSTILIVLFLQKDRNVRELYKSISR